ncbi:unnamed protein product [Rotaria magnacalcarata]|uniref:NAD(P)(+)--arginine ADP-ribosyltransferase n=1 Tax=Rotaria magnacalcarata TaxID=392030 RepID=A0A816FAP6_9BILA|nr:unnamed protein product [Rotaria magnacalcarata]
MAQLQCNRYISETLEGIQDFDLNPIQGYETKPLVSLEETTAMLVGLIPDIMKYVSVAKDKCNANADPLTRDESAAIYLYTMPKCVFRLLNNALRTQDRHKIAPWLSYLKLFIGALKKLPSCNGTVWRGASLDDGIIFTDGDIHTWWTVNSCSTDLQIIELYLGDKGTVFAIDAIEAKNISAFSAFPVERELILMPGTRVWPLSKKLNFKDQYFLVHLKEEDKQRLVFKILSSNSQRRYQS